MLFANLFTFELSLLSFEFLATSLLTIYSAGKYWSPGRLKNVSSNVPRMPFKNLFDHLEDVLIWRSGDVSKWRSRDAIIWRWETSLGGCFGTSQDVLRMSLRGPSKHSDLDVPKFLLPFLSELIRLTKSILKHFNNQGVLKTQSNL